jgi:hypothetical protein
MAGSVGRLIEIAAGGERGWAYFSEDFVIGSRRVLDAGGGQLEWMRPFGESHWTMASAAEPKEERSHIASVVGSLTRRSRRPLASGRRRVRPLGTDSSTPEPSQFTLWGQVLAGEITIGAAEQQATGLLPGDDVTDRGIDEASVLAKQLSVAGQAKIGALLVRLAHAVASGPASEISERTRADAACDLLEAARLSLICLPDPHLLALARRAGDAALAWGREHEESLIIQMATFRLGTIHLDPYQHDHDTYWFEHKTWLREGMAAFGTPPMDISEQDLRAFMPMPVPAVRTAEAYLREAVEARSGENRGFALKALVNALILLKFLGEDISYEDLARTSFEAAVLLPDDAEEPQRFVRQFLPSDMVAQLAPLPQPTGSTIGQSNQATALGSAAMAAAGKDPETANRLLQERRELVTGRQDGMPVDQFHLELRVAILNVLRPAHRRFEHWPEHEESQRALRVQVANGPDLGPVRCAVLLDLANSSAKTGTGPCEALQCIEDALDADPDRIGLREEVVDFLRARLWFDRAGELREEAARSGDPAELAMAYARAADRFHRADVPDLSVEALECVTEHFPSLSQKASLEVLNVVSGTTKGLGDRTHPETDRVVQTFLATALGHFLSGGLALPELVVWIANLTKGTRLASALSAGRRTGLVIPHELKADLERADGDEAELIEAAHGELPEQEDIEDAGADDWFLLGYADTVEQVGGADTPQRLLRGRQRQLDRALNRLLVLPGKSLELNLEGYQHRLGERSMLLIQLPARWKSGSWGTSWLLVTRTGAHTQFVDNSDVPYGDLTVEVHGHTMRSSPDMLFAEALRRELQEDPGPGVATDEALKFLHGERLGDLWARLEECLETGHDHLIVAPHGPGHYVPWHLLGAGDEPLASRCAVTMVPSIGMLAPPTFTDLAMRLQHVGGASFGLSYRSVSSQGLGGLAHAEHEASEVASVLGVEPVLEERATVEAIIKALKTARFVHISAHGRHNATAAAFQAILLAGSPSRLTAHRLSECDLRGLQLVTLSACETALGRFDRADNLRGIPAALLLAGVQTIVGALWQVPDATSRAFFTAMYREVGAGRDVVAAFQIAQHEARQAFPAYRDWGGFVLMGGLNQSNTLGKES